MLLARYLALRRKHCGETTAAFARRAMVPVQTLHDVLNGKDCRMSTAHLLVSASREMPVPGGGVVDYGDLVPELKLKRLKPRRRSRPRAAAEASA